MGPYKYHEGLKVIMKMVLVFLAALGLLLGCSWADWLVGHGLVPHRNKPNVYLHLWHLQKLCLWPLRMKSHLGI